jgi:hypothetical protein
MRRAKYGNTRESKRSVMACPLRPTAAPLAGANTSPKSPYFGGTMIGSI